jgi:hypothetical protein
MAIGFYVLDSNKSKFSYVILEPFLIECTTGRGLDIVCNTLKMLVVKANFVTLSTSDV